MTCFFIFLSVERQNWTFEKRGEFLSFSQSIIMYTKGELKMIKSIRILFVTSFDPDQFEQLLAVEGSHLNLKAVKRLFFSVYRIGIRSVYGDEFLLYPRSGCPQHLKQSEKSETILQYLVGLKPSRCLSCVVGDYLNTDSFSARVGRPFLALLLFLIWH